MTSFFATCYDATAPVRCFMAALFTYAAQVAGLHSEPLFWLLLFLSIFDFVIGAGVAIYRRRFSPRRFRLGGFKLLGVVVIFWPLLLTDAILSDRPQFEYWVWFRDWILIYMCASEWISVSKHLRRMGVPVPSLSDLRRFQKNFNGFERRKTDRKDNGNES